MNNLSQMISMVPNQQQQQSGQKSFDINFNPYTHVQQKSNININNNTRMFANNPFQRSFASVVSCKTPILQKSSESKTSHNSASFFNTFLKKIAYPKRTMLAPKVQPFHVQKEFEDFKTLPSYVNNHKTAASKPNSSHTSMHDSKNKHTKQRHSIEHDIRVDCDIFNVKRVNNNNISTAPASASKSATKNLPSNDDTSSPPFEIYSLEEFPAITTTVTACTSSIVPPVKIAVDECDESDYVKYQDDIAKVTPTFVPRRINLCEKVSNMISSPKKFLQIPLMSPKRSCLKPTPRRRTVSECSDDFIVFERNCCEEDDDDDGESVFDDDDDDVSDEEDDSVVEDESDDEDECDGNNEENSLDCLEERNLESQQPDSGMEERKVHFNLVPKIHTMIAWNHAYRQARRGDKWRQYAVDRERFAKRIADCGRSISPILDKSHRNRIFENRFQQCAT